ncbi:topoisomerase DNA-binding C4 zinc finger domain-containing protein [Ruminococcus sp.]
MKLNAVCPECGAVMKFKEGKYGEFLGCSRYPKCKHAEKIQVIGKII